MMSTKNTWFIFLISICFIVLTCCTEKTEKERLPNLLIVLSDQHSADMIGAYGNSQVITPNLDEFASQGIRFDNCFSNQPVCTPFRGMLMSGMHPLKNGAYINDIPLLPKPSLMANVLKEKGYQTAYVGKWHLLGGDRKRPIPKGELRYGFDKVLTNNCHVDFRPGKCFFWNEKGEREFFDEWEVYGQTRQALEYLDEVDPDKPFALVVSWHPPHDWGKFEGEDGKMHYRYDSMDELMAMYDRDSIKVRPGIETTPDRRRMYHGHMAMISGVDIAFGMLMDKLKNLGMEKNTLTVFSADHGDMLESHGASLPKNFIHDYSSRIPFIMRFPEKIKEAAPTSMLMSTLDMLPTIFGLMDIETEFKYDGINLAGVVEGKEKDNRQFVPVWNFQYPNSKAPNWRGVVTKDFSFCMLEDDPEHALGNVLFDRKKDPNQLNNLFNDPAYSDTKNEYTTLTYNWMEGFSDEFYSTADFEKASPTGGWAYNYSIAPMDQFKKNSER